MREILFRGKRTDNGEWVKGYYYKAKYCRTDDELCDYITVPHPKEYNEPSSHYIVDPDTVGQYTGLKDKNGTKIFEGDIVEITFHSDVKYQYLIWFNKEMSCWKAIETKNIRFNGNDYYGNNVEYSDFCFILQDPYGDIESVKIIGNLHDNPELLGGNNNG